jgi:PPM family protein phosphatase
MATAMIVSSLSHQGLVRTNNEDRLLVKTFDGASMLLAVADGMGGHAAGEVAAQIVADTLEAFDPMDPDPCRQIVELFEAADRLISQKSLQNPAVAGMGTTATVAFVSAHKVYWGHVGDSRLYLFHASELLQVSEDHTVPGMLVKEGGLTSELARTHPLRNMLLKCLGCNQPQPDAGSFEVSPGDLVVLTSDGLHDAIPERAMAEILASDATLESRLQGLLQAALATGGRDNITVVAAVVE